MISKLLIAFSLLISATAFATPVILTSGTNIKELRGYNDILTVSVIASEAGGTSSLAGGILADSLTGAIYGPLESGAQKGTYSISLAYNQITKVHPYEPNPLGRESRAFSVNVYGADGSIATKDIIVDLVGERYAPVDIAFINSLPPEIREVRQWNKNYIGLSVFEFKLTPNFEKSVVFYKKENYTTFRNKDNSDVEESGARSGQSLYDEVETFLKQHGIDNFLTMSGQDKILSFRLSLICIERSTGTACWELAR